MILFPAIDIRGGKCVRLTEGRFDMETVFSDDPSEMAVRWSEAGAEYLHVVDLDGALAGTSQNLPAIKKIIANAKMPALCPLQCLHQQLPMLANRLYHHQS